MKYNKQLFFTLLLSAGFMMPSLQAQVINFEETWQEFLKNEKTSSVSKLPEPAKDQTNDYLKYMLMTGNSSFCAGDFKTAEERLANVKRLGEPAYKGIPSFKEKYDDLTNKMQAAYKVDEAWGRFLQSRSTSDKELKMLELGRKVCDKGTLAKVFYMDCFNQYCKGDVAKSKEVFEGRVLQLTEKTTFSPTNVKGLPAEIKLMKEVYAGIAKLDVAWGQFMSTDKSPGFPTDIPQIDCYTIPQMKVYILRAALDVCKNGPEMLEKIRELQKTNTHPIPDDVRGKIEWLEKEVGSSKEDLAVINKAWAEFVPKDKIDNTDKLVYDFPCNKDAQIKAYIMDGMSNLCTKGASRLEDITKLRAEAKPALDETTIAKIKLLETKIKKMESDLAALEKAWGEFTPTDSLTTGTKFGYEYPCNKEAEIRAYLITGLTYFCEKGKVMLDNINKNKAGLELSPEVTARIEKLAAKQAQNDTELAALNKAWAEYTPKDTLLNPLESYQLMEFYCDKIAQVKSWVIKGSMNPCPKGQDYLNLINNYQKTHKLTFDAALTCEITSLRIKVWDCRYWEIVAQARKETHEEREKFGPASAQVMQADLNTGKTVCPTSVKYEPLGYIGIRYVITISLCQTVDVAQMGDPNYYKKIADWVNNQVLVKYCNTANWRCKEDFFIYIEGHTDGNSFSGASYQRSLEIPQGTPFTHYTAKDTTQKVTDRAITTALKNNMELGIARAWSVKQQLDFMKVPIKVGAYEHPPKEKGAEFRKIDTELTITNLLLDFYEKRLKELLIASGIGERPKAC